MYRQLSEYVERDIKKLCGEDVAKQMLSNLDVVRNCINILNEVFQDHISHMYLKQFQAYEAYAGVRNPDVPVVAMSLSSAVGKDYYNKDSQGFIAFTNEDVMFRSHKNVSDVFNRELKAAVIGFEDSLNQGSLTDSQKSLYNVSRPYFFGKSGWNNYKAEYKAFQFFSGQHLAKKESDLLVPVFTSATDFEKSIKIFYSSVALAGVKNALEL